MAIRHPASDPQSTRVCHALAENRQTCHSTIMSMKTRNAGSLPLFQNTPSLSAPLPDYPFDAASVPDHRFENFLHANGHTLIAGTDEAGRGPLAGPVVAAAVILQVNAAFDGLNDSKKLTEKKRGLLFDEVMQQALSVSVTSISAETIDTRDIRKASLEAMRRSIACLSYSPTAVLLDGRDIPPGLPATMRADALIKGDGRSMSIAAAAIIAKVTRDHMMAQLGAEHPDYLLEKHVGYGSAHHRDVILSNGGIKRVHRYSFRPLRIG